MSIRILLALLAGLVTADAAAQTLAPPDYAAGEILFNGTGLSPGKVALGSTRLDLSGKTFACRGCHRRDGAGGQEGRAPPIGWNVLSRATAERPAYDRASFEAALKNGIRAGGGSLDASMPRYDLPDNVLESLLAYLDALPRLQRAGITSDRLTFGVAVPPDNREPAEHYFSALQQALLRQTGGVKVFGRTVEVVRLDGELETMLARATHDIVAIVGLVPSGKIGIGDFTRVGVPVLFPLALIEGDEDETLVKSFLPTLDDQAEALVRRALADGARRIGLATGVAHLTQDLAAEVREATLVPLPTGMPTDGLEAILFAGIGAEDAVALLEALPDNIALYGIAGELPALPTLARERGMALTLVNGYAALQRSEGAALLDAHAQEAAELLHAAVLQMGRGGATRAQLMSAFDRTRFPALGLDYMKFPLSGTAEVGFVSHGN